MEDPSVDDARSRRVGLGVAAGLLNPALGTLGQLLVVPLFFAAWGAHRYGEWLTLAAGAGYVAVLDLGVQMYVVNRLGAAYARGESADYTRILHSALYWSLSLAAVACAGAALVAAGTPALSWLDLAHTGPGAAAWIATLLALQIALSLPVGIVSGIYRTIGEYPRGAMIANGQRALHLGLTATVLLAGGGPAGVAGVQLVPPLLVALFVARDVRRRHPEIDLSVRARDARLALSFLRPSLLFFLVQAALVMTLQGSVLLTSVLFGAGTVALFVSLRTLAHLARQVASTLTHSLWPELTALEARGERARLRRMHLLAVKGTTCIALALALFLHHSGREVVELWTGGRLAYDARLMDALCLLVALEMPWTTSMYFLLASNRHAAVARLMLAASVLGIALAAVLAPMLGPVGIVAGIALAEIGLCSWTIPARTCRLLEQPGVLYARTVARGLTVAVLAFAVGAMIVALLPDLDAPLRVAVTGPLLALVTGTLVHRLWLDASERRVLRDGVERLFTARAVEAR